MASGRSGENQYRPMDKLHGDLIQIMSRIEQKTICMKNCSCSGRQAVDKYQKDACSLNISLNNCSVRKALASQCSKEV